MNSSASLHKAVIMMSYLCYVACSPLKGYSGPERPSEQLAILENDSSQTAYVDGNEFTSRGIALLPGKHFIEVTRVARYSGHDCQYRTEFDNYGYESCRDDREEAIAKGKEPSSCLTSSYTSTIQGCTYPYKEYSCRAEVLLLINTTYKLTYGTGIEESPMTVTTKNSASEMEVSCSYARSWESYEESTI